MAGNENSGLPKGYKNKKTLERERQLSRIYKHRFGLKYGMTLHEMIYLYYGDKKITKKRIDGLGNLRKELKKERIRNIIPRHFKQVICLDDRDLPELDEKLGFRECKGWIYFQPKKIEHAEHFRSWCDRIAHSVEASGERSVDLAREQITEEQMVKEQEKTILTHSP